MLGGGADWSGASITSGPWATRRPELQERVVFFNSGGGTRAPRPGALCRRARTEAGIKLQAQGMTSALAFLTGEGGRELPELRVAAARSSNGWYRRASPGAEPQLGDRSEAGCSKV